jgi:MFS transporter, PHS family, inorganic phosphate transporter
MMAAVFSMQGAGQFAAAIVALVVTVGFRDSFTAAKLSECDTVCQLAADRCWRIIIGAGALPAIFALYYRITIPETPRYTFDVAQDIEKADADIKAFKDGEADGHPDAMLRARAKIISSPGLIQPRASWADFFEYFGTWKNGSLLFATMASWFFLDLAFYGLGLNNAVILQAIGYGSSSPSPGSNSIYRTLLNTAVGNLILVCAGSLPGYWLSVALIDTIGRRPIQIGGFAILTVLFCILGFAYNSLSEGAQLALYVLAQLFFNFGPNTTTFIIPGECFPTRYRSTGHGLSAASGKVGAIIAQVIAAALLSKDAPPNCSGTKECYPWLPHLMEIFACFMLCGTVVSFLIPETKRLTLEELAGEKPLHHRNSGTASPSSKKSLFFQSPVLSPMRSPVIPPLNSSKKESGSGASPSKNGRTRISSKELKRERDRERDSSERENQSPHHSGSVSSEGAILHNLSQANTGGRSSGLGSHHSAAGGHARSESAGSGRYWMESIPLQDVGGLALK